MFCAMIASACAACVPVLLAAHRHLHGRAHVGRQIGRGADDEVEDAVEEGWKHPNSIIPGRRSSARSVTRTRPPSRRPRRRSACTRIERDPLGEYAVPADAYYGIQTAARARELSDQRPARAGRPRHRHRPGQEGGGAGERRARAARRRRSATPSSSAADEVLGRRAARSVRRGRLPGGRRHVAQHEHQRGARQPRRGTARRHARRRTRWSTRTTTSTWASRPTTCSRPRRGWRCCSRIAGCVDAARGARGIARRARRARSTTILKVGRTHLQDAVPMTLGQEFSGYAACIARGADDVERAAEQLQELNLGATAVGTGLNAGDGLHAARGREPAPLHGAAAQARGQPLPRHAEHGRRRSPTRARCGVWRWSSRKVASDLRLLSMGPRAGIARDRAARRAARARRSCRAR